VPKVPPGDHFGHPKAPQAPLKTAIRTAISRRSINMAATSFTPLHDTILVRRIEEAGITPGGIIIPDSAKEKPLEGTVLAVGKGKSNDEGRVFPLDVKVGDHILFAKYRGSDIRLDGEELLILKEEEVFGILKK
jgi:chaperonin GroES